MAVSHDRYLLSKLDPPWGRSQTRNSSPSVEHDLVFNIGTFSLDGVTRLTLQAVQERFQVSAEAPIMAAGVA